MKHIPLAQPTPNSRRSRLGYTTLLILLAAMVYVTIVLTHSIAPLQPNDHSATLHITTPASNLPWPAYGQAAFGLSSGQVIASHGLQTPVPMASTAKLITALCVLQRKPLATADDGPIITLSQSDVDLYNQYVAKDGSVLAVSSGEQITERQALQAILLPSANNIADSLAIWAFGSFANYKSYAINYAQTAGLHSTTIGSDASGFAPDSTSTASDLVKLGALAMQNATIAQIVGQPSATLPGVGLVHNVNSLLGTNNIVGVKTGNNDQDGGVFIGAATTSVGSQPVTIISAVAGGSNLDQVLASSSDILTAARSTFASTTIVTKGAVLGSYRQANGTSLQAVAANDLSIVVLRGASVTANIQLNSTNYQATAGDVVGTITLPSSQFAAAASQPIILKQTPHQPGVWYRLLHP